MAVRHILKDGSEIHDITGHVVKMDDAQVVYALMDRINEKAKRKGVVKHGHV